MSEKCVVTFRVMFDTDDEEKARNYAQGLTNHLMLERNYWGERFVLDAEVTGQSRHGGRSFLYRDPATTTKGDA